jgi:hypothetical protein
MGRSNLVKVAHVNLSRQGLLALSLITSMLPVRGLSKDKVSPDEFTLSAVVTAVSSSRQVSHVSSERHSNVDPACTVMGPDDPRRARVNCDAQAAGSTTTSSSTSWTRFVVTAAIGDKVYDLEGSRVELATYRARFVTPHRGHRAEVELLTADKKGKVVILGYTIVGERLKDGTP